jgi:hypothetical protein
MRPEPVDIVGTWHRFENSLTRENIAEFLKQVSTIEWLVHVNQFNLANEIEFIEICGLDSLILANEFEYPILHLDDGVSAIADVASILRDTPLLFQQAQQLLHLRCREFIREGLALPKLTRMEKDRFLSKRFRLPLPISVELLLSFRLGNVECSEDELAPVASLLKSLYPEIHAYFVAAGQIRADSKTRKYGLVGWASSAMTIVESVVKRELPANRKDPHHALIRYLQKVY